ncbi:hypothetical protein M7I_2918 [Glarea lozoyensis 74030]|uniref:Uncharacterized protein n=1 Tax=Glarea lozoyensis (strain ATCC 74030 / MF5533) TaxID=1104152 RepID=H0EK29_GLAL7|nr:hypothetical protein M7I_2918 [Glarea lozoyensis 74030]
MKKISEACCLYFLNMNGDKIIPTLEGIKRDILMREEKLKATGRINWEREILILADRTKPTSSKVRCRDEQIRCLEEDDANFKAVLSHGWRSPYAMTVKGTYKEEKQRQAEFKVYQDEAKFRETRAKVYEKLRGRGATPEELEAQMEKWDRSNNNTAEFLHDAHKVDMIANPVTAKEVADAKDASLRQIALNLAGDTEESKREFGMDTGQLLTPEEIAYNRALYIWLTAYIRKHSAPSSTTPTGRPRRNHRSSTHLEAPLMALYKPADMRELPASLEFEDETMQYEHEMCMLETHLRRFYVGLMDFYDGPRKKEYWSEAHLLAESSLFEFCYNLNVAFANWTRKNPRALQNVEGFGYLNYLPQALVSGREADRIRQKQEQYDPRISFNERGLIFPGIDDNRKSFFSLWDRPPKDDLRKLKATGLKIGPPIPTTTAHSSKSQPTGSEVTTPTPSLNTAAHSETAQKGVPMGPFDMTNPIYREHVEAARHALQEMTLARKNISTYLDTPAFGTETGSTPEKLEGDLTSAEKLQRARAEATEAYKQRRLRRAEGLSKSKPVAQGKSEFASDKGKEAGDTDKSGEVKEPKVAEKNVEGMKEAIQQAAIDKVAGRAAMLRNIRGQTTPTKSEEDSRTSNPTQTGKQEEDSQTSTPAQTGKQKEEQKIIIKVPVPDAYDINGFRLVEEKEVTRVIAKPRKKSTQTMFKDMNKSKVDKTVNLVSKGEGDGSGKEEAQTAPAVNESGGDEYAVKGGDEAVPEGVVEKDEDGSTEDEAFDYEDHIIRRFPDMWEYFLQTQREATPRIEHRSEHWTEKKAQAAQEELVEYWSQFDKATRKLFHTMNGMYMVLGDGKVTNGPFSEMEFCVDEVDDTGEG